MPDETKPTEAVEVFYSYAHKDERLKKELLKHLSNIERQKIIISWHDRKLTPGREWAGEIDKHVDTAGLILLLVTPDFMFSGYCNEVELKRAMQRHEAGEARVIPIILRPVDWKGAPFEKLQALPTDAKPVTTWKNRDEAFKNIAEGVRKAVQDIAAPTGKKAVSNIPRPPVVGFVARRDEQGNDIVKRLTEELSPDNNQLVALWGPGGTGKTTLAAEVVRATTDSFKGRVAWVSALGRSEFNLATLLDETATQLGREDLRRLAPEQKASEVGALVGTQPTLVVLDNFETIAEAEQQHCLDFLVQSAACPTLVTTRAFVNRDDVSNVPLAAMLMEEARDFLQLLIKKTRMPSNFNKLDLDDLIIKCEANPLVLQWVVRQVDLAKRPQDVMSDLAQGEGDAAERVFTRSFNLPRLGDDGRAALLALSLFTPDASREALADVSGFGDDLRRLDKAIESLSALWLVETTEGNERLFLRGLTRELAKSLLSKDARDDEFRRRFVEHFLRHVEAHEQPTSTNLDTLEAERDNVFHAIDESFRMKDWVMVIRIRSALDNFLFLHGHWDEAVKSARQAEAASRKEENEDAAAYFMSCAALVRNARGEYSEAEKIYREVLEIAKKFESDAGIGACLHQLGLILLEQGKLEEARKLYDESLELSKRVGDEDGVSATLHELGRVAQRQGDLEKARRLYIESLKIAKGRGNQEGAALTTHALGTIAYSQGDVNEAKRLYGESLTISKKLGVQRSIAHTSRNLGLIAEEEGDKTEAARLLREAVRIFEKLGLPAAESTRSHLARVNEQLT